MLDRKIALVTGGARGIGAAFTRALLDAGASVAVVDIDGVQAQLFVDELAAPGARAIAIPCDVRDDDAVTNAVQSICDRLGGIDILINNAGLHGTDYHQPVTGLPLEQWWSLLDVNVLGLVRFARACRLPMAARGGGVIINMSSTASTPAINAYGVSKLAVRGLTTALAHELADEGIRVFALAPGLIGTEVIQAQASEDQLNDIIDRQLIRRMGGTGDLVGAMLFFCSDASSFITGETLTVSGGLMLRTP